MYSSTAATMPCVSRFFNAEPSAAAASAILAFSLSSDFSYTLFSSMKPMNMAPNTVRIGISGRRLPVCSLICHTVSICTASMAVTTKIRLKYLAIFSTVLR